MVHLVDASCLRPRAWRVAAATTLLAALFVPPASAMHPPNTAAAPMLGPEGKVPPLSGIFDFKAVNFGTGLTECPQAGLLLEAVKPLDRRQVDQVEEISRSVRDRRANQDFSCFPQNETTIAVNPRDPRNIVGGANDYRLGFGTSGFFASTDGGRLWYDGVIPFATLPGGDHLDAGGDPAVVFDRAGVVYYADINFKLHNDTNGVFVSRSTNGGFTWSRPCVPFTLPPGGGDQQARCGGPGDPRQPGDGVVAFTPDDDSLPNGSVPSNDKDYIAAGPRPAGVGPVCFAALTRTPRPCDPATVGVDRLYVTWTVFAPAPFLPGFTSEIVLSFSDDQGRSWSPPRPIGGSAAFCAGVPDGTRCNLNQFPVPTVHPTTANLFVAFENFNTPDENQYLLVRSRDGGQSFEGPFFVSPIFDVNYPFAGVTRPDCVLRGQQIGRPVLTNSCFRVNAAGNVVVDKRGGAFADDLYLVLADNRNGTPAGTNTDVFLFKSTDGGSTWIGPTRVNDDPSPAPPDRDCGRPGHPPCPARPALGAPNDQWFPWADINAKGDLTVVFYDRRLDTASTTGEWPNSRRRPGNYLTWLWAAQCSVATPHSRECVAPEAAAIPQPSQPVDPRSGPPPGSSQSAFPFRNFAVSSVPSNMDYAFRAGVFIGDYNNVAVRDDTAYAFWTDARNGRSSRSQEGRNPACEQADVFVSSFGAQLGGLPGQPQPTDSLFLVAPCPTQAMDSGRPGP